MTGTTQTAPAGRERRRVRNGLTTVRIVVVGALKRARARVRGRLRPHPAPRPFAPDSLDRAISAAAMLLTRR
ncbi:hypothetical protein [Microbacterium sp.]|uniref:hypothetical protein n=1 Tax=Microbacterium sp. TaxID=51671 RepID=UPI0028119D81|nr:hypothetical protein [Microbacterium sp.]